MFGRPGGGTHDGMKEQGTAVELAASRIEPGHVAIAIQESEHEPPIDWTEVGIALNVAQVQEDEISHDTPRISAAVRSSGSNAVRGGNARSSSSNTISSSNIKNVTFGNGTSRSIEAGTFAPPSRRMQAWPVPPSMRAPDISHYVGHADSTQIPTGSPTSQVQGGGIAALLRTADTKVGELPAYEQALLALGRHGVSAIAVAEAEPPMLRDKNLGEIQRGDRGKQHPEEYTAALCRLRQGVDDAIACQDPSREFAALAKNRSFKVKCVHAS